MRGETLEHAEAGGGATNPSRRGRWSVGLLVKAAISLFIPAALF